MTGSMTWACKNYHEGARSYRLELLCNNGPSLLQHLLAYGLVVVRPHNLQRCVHPQHLQHAWQMSSAHTLMRLRSYALALTQGHW